VDYFVRGEGELVFKELLIDIARKREKIVEEQPVQDLDKLDFPTYDKNDISMKKFPYILPISGSRGCIFNCLFCSFRNIMPKYRERTADNIVEEMRIQKKKYSIDSFFFMDTLLNVRKNRLEDISANIINNNLKVYWCGYIKVHRLINKSVARKMYKAGCRYVRIGAESGSQKVLDEMNKGINVEIMQKNLKNLYTENIYIRLSFMVGYPTETNEDFLETFRFLIKINPNYNVFKHYKFAYLTEYWDISNPLNSTTPLSQDSIETRFKILLLFSKCRHNKYSDLFFRTKHYRTRRNNDILPVFKRHMVFDGILYSDKIIPLEKANIARPLHNKKIDTIKPSRPWPPCQKKDKTNCSECLEFLEVRKGRLYVCQRFLDKKTQIEIKEECKNCIYLKRRMCFPCYYNKNCFSEA